MAENKITWDDVAGMFDELRSAAEHLIHRRESQSWHVRPSDLVQTTLRRELGSGGGEAFTEASWDTREQFFEWFHDRMRKALTDYARHRKATIRDVRRQVSVNADLIENLAEAAQRDPEAVEALMAGLEQMGHGEQLLRWRTAIGHRYFEGLPVEQVAALMAEPKRTVERMLKEGKRFLHMYVSNAMTPPPNDAAGKRR